MNKIKVTSYVVLALVLVLVSVMGCQPAVEKPNDQNNGYDMNDNNYDMNNNNRYNNDNMDNNNIEEDDGIIDGDDNIGNDMYNMNDNDVSQRSDRIAGTLTRMNGIRGAAVVISDNTAIVGVDTATNNGNEISEDMRRRIESAVRNADNRIDEVRITNDDDMYDRINNMVLSMRRGRPVTEFTNEIRDLMDGITTNR